MTENPQTTTTATEPEQILISMDTAVLIFLDGYHSGVASTVASVYHDRLPHEQHMQMAEILMRAVASNTEFMRALPDHVKQRINGNVNEQVMKTFGAVRVDIRGE